MIRQLMLFGALVSLMAAPAVQARARKDAETLTIVSPVHTQSYTLAELKKKLKVVTVEVDDPLYKKKKTYDGFILRDVLTLVGPLPDYIDDIAFTAKDGYTPGIALAKAREHRAFVVFQEHGNPKRWEPVTDGKQTIDPSPFYLVWREGPKLGEEYPRPYQLVRIELVSYAAKFPKLYPADVKPDSSVMKGFTSFRMQCVRCHSINLEGGAIGPELNVPRNITEYWSTGTLKKFIHKVSDFRLKSKMPDFDKDLSEDDVSNILDYLEYMKDHK